MNTHIYPPAMPMAERLLNNPNEIDIVIPARSVGIGDHMDEAMEELRVIRLALLGDECSRGDLPEFAYLLGRAIEKLLPIREFLHFGLAGRQEEALP